MEEVVDTRRLDLTAAHPLGRVHRVDSALTRCLHRAVMGEMLMGNINDGYLEGLLRGYRSGILTSTDYANLCQCETIDGAAAPAPSRCAMSRKLPDGWLTPARPTPLLAQDMLASWLATKMHLSSPSPSPSPNPTPSLACSLSCQRHPPKRAAITLYILVRPLYLLQPRPVSGIRFVIV